MSLSSKFTYDFAGTGSLSASWSNWSGTGFKRNSDQGAPANSSAADRSYVNSITLNADQYIQAKVSVKPPSDGSCIFLGGRAKSDGQYAYFLQINNGGMAIYKCSNWSNTSLIATTCTITNGNTYRLEIEGTSLRAYDNGTLVISTTDSAITTANYAYGGFWTGSTTLTARIDDFEAGDIVRSLTPNISLDGFTASIPAKAQDTATPNITMGSVALYVPLNAKVTALPSITLSGFSVNIGAKVESTVAPDVTLDSFGVSIPVESKVSATPVISLGGFSASIPVKPQDTAGVNITLGGFTSTIPVQVTPSALVNVHLSDFSLSVPVKTTISATPGVSIGGFSVNIPVEVIPFVDITVTPQVVIDSFGIQVPATTLVGVTPAPVIEGFSVNIPVSVEQAESVTATPDIVLSGFSVVVPVSAEVSAGPVNCSLGTFSITAECEVQVGVTPNISMGSFSLSGLGIFSETAGVIRGVVKLQSEPYQGCHVLLINRITREIIGDYTTQEDGVYLFQNVPDLVAGYAVLCLPPSGSGYYRKWKDCASIKWKDMGKWKGPIVDISSSYNAQVYDKITPG